LGRSKKRLEGRTSATPRIGQDAEQTKSGQGQLRSPADALLSGDVGQAPSHYQVIEHDWVDTRLPTLGLRGHVDSDSPPCTGWNRFRVEAARPPGIRARANAPWYAVAAVCIGAFMGQLNTSIVSFALPTLQHNFDASLGDVTWVGLIYLLVLAGLVVPLGSFSDMVGRKLLYIYGFIVFIVGSVLCGLAPSLLVLDACRVIQAVGAAMLQANSVAIIALAAPPEKLGRAIGIQGTAQALGLAFGTTVGGLLIALGGWRLIFFVNVPIGVVGTILAYFLVPRSRYLQRPHRFDWRGLALFFPAIVALMYAVSFGNQTGWVSAGTVGPFLASVVLLVAFVTRERRVSVPMLALTLFRRVAFSVGITSGLLSYLVLSGTLFVVPFYLERALALSPGLAGLELAVMPGALALTAPFAGRVAERLGARPLTVAGMTICAVVLAILTMGKPAGVGLLVPLAGIGIGLGLFTPPNNAAIMASAPHDEAGAASGVINMTRSLGTAMGLAFTSLVFDLGAGVEVQAAGHVVRGFTAAAFFLVVTSLVAAGVGALRGGGELEPDAGNAER